jgi:hypothetical protein
MNERTGANGIGTSEQCRHQCAVCGTGTATDQCNSDMGTDLCVPIVQERAHCAMASVFPVPQAMTIKRAIPKITRFPFVALADGNDITTETHERTACRPN